MTLYEFLLFLHVLGAIAWIGAAMYVLLVTELALRGGDQAVVVRLLHYDDRLGPILYIPAGLIVLGAGIGLVLEGNWSVTGDGWVLAGLLALAAAFAVGFAFFLPAGKRLNRAVASDGPESPTVRRNIDRIRVLAWVDLVLLLLAVFVMTTKPF